MRNSSCWSWSRGWLVLLLRRAERREIGLAARHRFEFVAFVLAERGQPEIIDGIGQQQDGLTGIAHGPKHNGLVVGGLLPNGESFFGAGPLLQLPKTAQRGVTGLRVIAEREGNTFGQQSRLAQQPIDYSDNSCVWGKSGARTNRLSIRRVLPR